MSALLARLKKSSVVDRASELGKSELFKNKNFIKTHVPMMNLAFSGKLHGGFANGLIQLAGPSKHFKSNMALVLVRAFQDKYEDGIVIFYDSEFGSSEAYFEAAGVDVDRVLHVPLLNIEEFKMDCVKQLDELGKDDRVMILVDSVGNLASKKELDDALDGKSVADMTRAKQLKACFRMITPYLTLKNVAMVCINHSYQTQEMYSKTVVSGGTGIEYSSNTIMTIGKRQVKKETELLGWEFIMNANKSRYIKEQSKIPITVTYECGISQWSGLMDVALATGWVTKPKNGWYTRPSLDGVKNWRLEATNCADFWEPLLGNAKFCSDVEGLFALNSPKPEVFDIDEETGEILNYEDSGDVKLDGDLPEDPDADAEE